MIEDEQKRDFQLLAWSTQLLRIALSAVISHLQGSTQFSQCLSFLLDLMLDIV